MNKVELPKRVMVAAAIPEGSVVRIPEDVYPELGVQKIVEVLFSTPAPGSITWILEDGFDVMVGGAKKIEVVSLP